jgi:hypothetical protein
VAVGNNSTVLDKDTIFVFEKRKIVATNESWQLKR